MDNQYKTLHKSYRAELDTIEDEFKSERAELLSNCKGEVDSLFDRRRKAELQFLEAKQEREEKYQTELEAMQAKDAEDYNKLKIKLETDIQTLEQQLEAMRATYLLNTEKLEYNYRVLTERCVRGCCCCCCCCCCGGGGCGGGCGGGGVVRACCLTACVCRLPAHQRQRE